MVKPSLIHVVSSARRRGAEVYAVALAKELERYGGAQQFVVLQDGIREIAFPAGCEVIYARRAALPALSGLRELRSAVKEMVRPGFVVGHGFVATRLAVAAAAGLKNTPL